MNPDKHPSEMTLEEAIPDAEVAAYWLEYLSRFMEVYPHLDLAAAARRIEQMAPKSETPPERPRPVSMMQAVEDILAFTDEAVNLPDRPESSPRREAAERAEAERRLRARELGIPIGSPRRHHSEEKVLEWEERLQGGEA